jgi:hypothetical protein
MRRVCGEVFDAGGYPQGCAREPHEGDDHRADALVIAVDLGAGGPASEFFAAVEREAELLINDHMMFGRAMTRGGRRVPPEEWGSAFESGHRQRGAEVGSIGARYVDPELRPYLDALRWPDPLSFIGRAANEGA